MPIPIKFPRIFGKKLPAAKKFFLASSMSTRRQINNFRAHFSKSTRSTHAFHFMHLTANTRILNPMLEAPPPAV
jgi:hypothetical protein